MNPEMLGALAGGAFGLVNFGVLKWVADRMETEQRTANQTPRLIRTVAWMDLIVFPLVGYFVGPLVLA